MLVGKPEQQSHEIRILDDFIGVVAEDEGVFHPKVEPHDRVEKGQLLAGILGFLGQLLEEAAVVVWSVVLGVITPASTFERSILSRLGQHKEVLRANG